MIKLQCGPGGVPGTLRRKTGFFVFTMGINTRTRDIIRDNLSGSQDIAGHTAIAVGQLVRERPSLGARDLGSLLRETAREILQAQPLMASLYHLFARVLAQLDQASSDHPAAQRIQRACRSFIGDMEAHNRCISEQLFKIIRHNGTVVTHSSSRTVRDALLACWARRKRFSVICGESRPAGEGVHLARHLARRGIPTTLTTDPLVPSFFSSAGPSRKRVDMVLIGADAVTPSGLINKAGTLGLAIVAKQYAVPLYSLAGTEKLLPAGLPLDWASLEKPADEIVRRPFKGLKVVNRYFDLTPLSHISAVVTEVGPLDRRGLQRELKSLDAEPSLRALMREIRRTRSLA